MKRKPVSLTFELMPSGSVEEAETIIRELVETTIQKVMPENQTIEYKKERQTAS